jgi:hypothetical protein
LIRGYYIGMETSTRIIDYRGNVSSEAGLLDEIWYDDLDSRIDDFRKFMLEVQTVYNAPILFI